MYIPQEFIATDSKQINRLIKTYPFGLLCHADEQVVEATHLPFIFHSDAHELVSHLAIQNKQASMKDGQLVKVIFSGPHGYISPSLYDAKYSVPTWNYLAVHLSGRITYIDDRAEIMQVMDEMISTFEPAFLEKWHASPKAYINGMFSQLRAFKIAVEKTEAVAKLSQNKSVEEQQRIAEYLINSTDSAARETGYWMKEHEE